MNSAIVTSAAHHWCDTIPSWHLTFVTQLTYLYTTATISDKTIGNNTEYCCLFRVRKWPHNANSMQLSLDSDMAESCCPHVEGCQWSCSCYRSSASLLKMSKVINGTVCINWMNHISKSANIRITHFIACLPSTLCDLYHIQQKLKTHFGEYQWQTPSGYVLAFVAVLAPFTNVGT